MRALRKERRLKHLAGANQFEGRSRTNECAGKDYEPGSLADYLEIMSKSVFQSGISWRVVESKWPGVREAMCGFDPHDHCRALAEPQLDELAQDSSDDSSPPQVVGYNGQRPEACWTWRAEHGGFPKLPAFPRQL